MTEPADFHEVGNKVAFDLQAFVSKMVASS